MLFMEPVYYPYLPDNRTFCFASQNNLFIVAAKNAQEECSGDSLYPVGAVLVKEGKVLARAGNGFNQGPGTVHVCPRIVQECASGTGYDLCGLHDSPGHAEAMLIQEATKDGIDVSGSDVYLYGHWWCCKSCWNVMINVGVRDVYLLENPHVEFDRDRVYAKTLQTSIHSACIVAAQNLGEIEQEKLFLRTLADSVVSLGCRAMISFTQEWVKVSDVVITDVSCVKDLDKYLGLQNKPVVAMVRRGNNKSESFVEDSRIVYLIEYEDVCDACRQLRNVLRQL